MSADKFRFLLRFASLNKNSAVRFCHHGKHPKIRCLESPNAPKTTFPLSQSIIAGDTLYITGQKGLDPKTVQLVPGGVEAECRQALKNIGTLLKAAGADYGNVVKVSIQLTDMADFDAVNKIYGEVFKPPYPARSAYQVGGLAFNARIQIETTALLDDK